MTTTLADHRAFLRRALSRPGRTGAVLPTSTAMAAAATAVVPPTGTVVELGAGTGALCDAVRARLAPGARYVAVELDPELVAHLRERRPWLEVLEGDAADLPALLAAVEVGPVDAVVSSLPWTLLPPARRRATLDAVVATMAPGAVFTTISLCTAAPSRVRALRALLAESFDEVRSGPTVWRSVPPGRVLAARRGTTAPC